MVSNAACSRRRAVTERAAADAFRWADSNSRGGKRTPCRGASGAEWVPSRYRDYPDRVNEGRLFQKAILMLKSICRGLATDVGWRKYCDVITPLKPV